MIKFKTRVTALLLGSVFLFAINGCNNTEVTNEPVTGVTAPASTVTGTESTTAESSVQEKVSFETAGTFVENVTAGWNAGNTLDSFGTWITDTSVAGYETAWGNPQITGELIKYVKDLGFNTVRVPVTYAQHIDGSGKIDDAWLLRVKEVVDYCMAQDLYCIINIHHDTGAGNVAWLKANEEMYNSGMSDRYVSVWSQIADYFRDYGDKLIFEGFNEILDINSNWGGSDRNAYNVVNMLNQLFVDTVRASGGNNPYRNLIVNAYGASNYDSQLDGFVLPKDSALEHIMASVHIYSPQNFCDGNDGAFDDNDAGEIEEAFVRVHNKLQLKYNIPVIVGECGVVNKIKTPQFSQEIGKYYACMAENAQKYGMACICWDNGGDMALIDRKSLTVKEKEAIEAIMNIVK